MTPGKRKIGRHPFASRDGSPLSLPASLHRLSFSSLLLLVVLGGILLSLTGARLLPAFLRDLTASDPFNRIYYLSVEFFGSSIEVPRPTHEVRSELQKLLASQNSDVLLYRLLAEQDERALDLASAEKNYQLFVSHSSDKVAALAELADFYLKQQRWEEAVKTLLARAEQAPNENAKPVQDQLRYRLLHQIIDLVESRRPSRLDSLTYYRQLVTWYPGDPLPYQEAQEALLKRKQHDEAVRLLEVYRQRFPKDQEYALNAQARIFESQGRIAEALAVYFRNYHPGWNDSLVNTYVELLRRTGRFEAFVQDLAQKLKQNPVDFQSATLLFRSLLSQGKLEDARNVLFHFREEKETRNQKYSDDELGAIGNYFYSLNHFNEAARYFSTLYLQTSDPRQREESLFQLYEVMLDAQNQTTQLGGGSLHYFKTVASIDADPGFLNGLLSLVLNRTSPQRHYSEAEERAVSYFNRARSAEILEQFEKEFPSSAHLSRMQYQALETLKIYGQWETIVQRGWKFLDAHASTLEVPSAGILMADAYANQGKTEEEFKVYGRLLDLLNQRPHLFVVQSPGRGARQTTAQMESANETQAEPVDSEAGLAAPPAVPDAGSARMDRAQNRQSLEEDRLAAVNYSFVMEQFVARLTASKRYLDVVSLFRKELDRNPEDEALYARFAEYLLQHRFFQEEMEIYQQAISRFNKAAWYDKLARWYLRRQRQADFSALSRKFIDAFKGSALEEYFSSSVSQVGSTPFYEELNLYANRRFPHNRVFARNLATYYLLKKRWPEWEAISRKYFMEDNEIRRLFYQYLSEFGRLSGMTAELETRSDRNPAQERFLADSLHWQSEHEKALPHYQKLVGEYPTDPEIVSLTADILRSLGAYALDHYRESAQLRENLAKFNPDDTEVLTRIGETFADTENYSAARQAWQRIPLVNPSDRNLHLEVATLFWDYYLYDDSLKSIQTFRQLANDPLVMAYEAGAIYEDQRSYGKAVEEYVNALSASLKVAVADTVTFSDAAAYAGGDERALQRLRFLARRKNLGSQIDERFTASIRSLPKDLRYALAYCRYLKSSDRLPDLRKFLLRTASSAPDRAFLNAVASSIQQHGFYEVQEAGLQRLRELALTPEQRLGLDIELAQFYENRNRTSEAQSLWERLLAGNPKSVGLIRDLEDFYWRHKQYALAINLLEQTIPRANDVYRKQLSFDLAQKALELKDYDRAIALAQELLKGSPLDTTYSAFLAQAFAKANRYAELVQFYSAQLQAIRSSSLGLDEKRSRTVTFRRGIIEAQKILKDFTAALDQYVEIINLDAEDSAVTTEAADFASEEKLVGRLRGYYQTTAQKASKDHRWPLVLAHLEERWGRLPESIIQYEAVLRIRPERQDLYLALASLQQRLLDFPAAIATYQKAYALSYKDSSYLLKIADLQARLGKKPDALESLKKAYGTEAALPVPQYFTLVEKLDQWGMLEEAKPFIDEGWRRFTQSSGTESYGLLGLLSPSVRISVERRDEENTLYALLGEYRKLESVKGRPGGNEAFANLEVLRRAFLDLGKLVEQYYSPEEKLKFQRFLEKLQPTLALEEKKQLMLPMAEAAGLPDLQEVLLKSIVEEYLHQFQTISDPTHAAFQEFLQQLIVFYARRQAYDKAAVTLVTIWEQNPLKDKDVYNLIEPAIAARKMGNPQLELSVLEKYFNSCRINYDSAVVRRYYELLTSLNQEARIIEISQKDNRLIPDLINALIDQKKQPLAETVIRNYGKHLPPVWTKVQLAMTGAHFRSEFPQVAPGFRSALNLKPVGALLSNPPNTNEYLYGADWFFYARAYGKYLSVLKNPQATDYLIAQAEFAPVSSARQDQLAELLLNENQVSPAIDHFDFALQLDSFNAAALDGEALAWMKQAQAGKAISNWLHILKDQDRAFSLPNLQVLYRRIRQFKLHESFRQPLESFLKMYVRRNHVYQIQEVVIPALDCFSTLDERASLLRDLALETQTFAFVEHLLQMPEFKSVVGRMKLPLQSLYEAAINAQRGKLKEMAGEARQFELNRLVEFELKAIEYLLQNHLNAQAEALLNTLLARGGPQASEEGILLEPYRLRGRFLKARFFLQTNRKEEALSELASVYQRQAPIQERRGDYLLVADLLKEFRLPGEARRVLGELYSELIKVEPWVNANYLGLAETCLEGGLAGEALATLQRMNLSRLDNIDGYRQSAELLTKFQAKLKQTAAAETTGSNLQARAREMLEQLAKLSPFDLDARLRLAEMLGNSDRSQTRAHLHVVLASRQSRYSQKAQAAKLAGRLGIQDLTFPSTELQLLAELAGWKPPAVPPSLSGLSNLPLSYQARLFASDHSMLLEGVNRLEQLRVSLWLKPIQRGMKDETNTLLFSELLKTYSAAKQPRLLTDLFEQYGRNGAQYYQYLPGTDNEEEYSYGQGSIVERESSYAGPQPLAEYKLTPTQKTILLKLVLEAYSNNEDYITASGVADQSAPVNKATEGYFEQQAAHFRIQAENLQRAHATKFAVNERLGEEFSTRKPPAKPKRRLVRT